MLPQQWLAEVDVSEPDPPPAMRNVLIQGASRGIGLEMARQLAARRDTDHVIATCRAPERAAALSAIVASRPRSTLLTLDLCDESSLARAAARSADAVHHIDLLINCAGVLHAGALQPERRLADVKADHLALSFQVNAFGPLLVAKYFEGLLGRSKRALFASLSARVGSIGDNRLGGWYSYRASKAAQNMFTRSLAIEWARRRPPITCLALHPGTVATDLSAPFRARTDASRVFDVATAVRQLLAIIDHATPDDSGRFVAWDGTDIAW